MNFLSKTNIPPNVKNLLDKYGDAKIKYIKINRQPVQSSLMKMLNLFSKDRSRFETELKKLPYDSLYHLQLQFSTSAGRVVLEKNERVNMAERPKEVQTLEIQYPSTLTIRQIYDNALKAIGPDKFYKYNASSNNCQDFVMALLQHSGLHTQATKEFVKQDTKTLFEGDNNLRKVANSTTSLGAYANMLMQGGEIDDDQEYYEEEYDDHECSCDHFDIDEAMDRIIHLITKIKDHLEQIKGGSIEKEEDIVVVEPTKKAKAKAKAKEKVKPVKEPKVKPVKEKKPPSKWITHVKQYSLDHPELSYKQAMKEAKESYVKQT